MTAKINGSAVLQRIGMALVSMGLAGLLAACGGGNAAPPVAAPPAAAITAQATDQSTVAGTTATFSVTATNATGYQWQRSSNSGASFADVSGATATSYTTAATTSADSGTQYRVLVSGAGGNVTSSAATLTVTAAAVAPSITVQPANQTITAGQNASFAVTAAGTALAYQWQHSMDGGNTFTDEAGATAATLTLSAVAQLHNGHFLRVVVSNSLGSVTSTAALLTVNAATAAAAITQQPASQSVTAPAVATFSAAASGTPAPTFQWQLNSGAGWDNIIGATSASYTTPATAVGDSGKQYRVMATNATGSVTSNAATLTVSAAATMPAITGQPSSVTITAGQGAAFIVGSSGTPLPTVQWQLSIDNGASWTNITGATSDVLNLPAGVPLSDNGRQFRAVASNTSGSATSLAAVLTVNPSFVPTFQFNLFGFNAGPAVFLLYGGSVKDATGTIQCSGYAGLSDPCPKWRADYPSGTLLSLTATAWPGWRVSRWVGGDCGLPGNASTVTLTINHNSNCHPQFELIPGSTFSVSGVAAGAWVGLVVEVVADRFGNLVVADAPRISCGPLASAQICDASVAIGDSPYTVMRLKAFPLFSAPVGQIRWTCISPSPDNASTAVTQTVVGADIAIGPIYGNTACSAELIPTP